MSVTPGRMEGSQILATTFATYSDVIEEERIIDKSIASDPIEPSFACEHSSQRSMLKRTEDKDVNNEKAKPRSLQTFPDQCASFAQVDNGQCLYTDCFVGGDSGLNYDCFFKGQDTDNGCGNDLIAQLGVGTDFEFYSFARPCCIHDFCYSSITFDQTTCDIEFYSDMIEECNELSQICSSVCDGKSGLELISCNTLCTSVVAACEVNALAYYGIVNLGGEDAYNSAKSNTKVNQENAVCNNYPPIAICKSTLIIFAGPDGKASLVPQDIDDGSNSNLPDPLVYSFVSPEDEDEERLYFKCDESLGEREITLRVSNSGGSSSCTSIVTLVDNTAPVLVNCPVDLVRDLNMAVTTGPDRATCDQEASWIPPEVEDNCSGATLTSTHDLGETFQVGVTEVVYTAKDSSDNESTCSFAVEVFDSTVPIIKSKPLIVAPRNPNHKFDNYSINDFASDVFDNCGGISMEDVFIKSATSDDDEKVKDPGDGNTSVDIVMDTTTTTCKSIGLARERVGNGDGRVYGVTTNVVDASGNLGEAKSFVHIRKNKKKEAVDSGISETVECILGHGD